MPDLIRNPDILTCLANLSNDEVFTPPEVANAMLDLIPEDFWKDPNVRVLDPACKSGVFLREAAKRFLKGEEEAIPDLKERIDHIFHKQLFGYAITELTSHLSRRTVYCSKTANGKYSVTPFKSENGNIAFSRIEHTWEDGKCKFCGASQEVFDRGAEAETHAYKFIHLTSQQIKDLDMKFDLIIGNPPYQLADGGNSSSASPIYQKFIQQAKLLKPRYLTMIIPSRWFAGGKGLDEFRAEMISDKRIRSLDDFLNASDCFGTGVEIKGGVCYFLWDRDNKGKCNVTTHINRTITSVAERYLQIGDNDVFIRRNEAVSILNKVTEKKETTFDSIVSSRKPFGLPTNVITHKEKQNNDVSIYIRGGIEYINVKDISRNKEWLNKDKIYLTKAYNAGDDWPHQIINQPIIGGRDTCCSETYLVIGPFNNSTISQNVVSYIKTKFFRFLVSLRKISQDATQKVYSFVPMQDFYKPWTDEELYEKYGLTDEEIAFIESMIKPME